MRPLPEPVCPPEPRTRGSPNDSLQRPPSTNPEGGSSETARAVAAARYGKRPNPAATWYAGRAGPPDPGTAARDVRPAGAAARRAAPRRQAADRRERTTR